MSYDTQASLRAPRNVSPVPTFSPVTLERTSPREGVNR